MYHICTGNNIVLRTKIMIKLNLHVIQSLKSKPIPTPPPPCIWKMRPSTIPRIVGSLNPNILWQKEATDKSTKSEKVTFLDWPCNWHILLPFWVWSRNTPPAERYSSQDIMVLHCQCTRQTHFANLRGLYQFQELLPFVRVRQISILNC